MGGLGSAFLPIGSFKGGLGGMLEESWGILGDFGWILGYLGVIFGGSWGYLGAFCRYLGVSWGIWSS